MIVLTEFKEVVPIRWDADTSTWELYQVVVAKTVHVDEGNYILRKGPKPGVSTADLGLPKVDFVLAAGIWCLKPIHPTK